MWGCVGIERAGHIFQQTNTGCEKQRAKLGVCFTESFFHLLSLPFPLKQRSQNLKEDEHKTWFQLKRVKGRENFSQRRDKTEHVYTVSSVKYRKDDQTKVIVHARNQGRVHRGLRAAQLR